MMTKYSAANARPNKSIVQPEYVAEYVRARHNTVSKISRKPKGDSNNNTIRSDASGKKMFKVRSMCGKYFYHIGVIDYL